MPPKKQPHRMGRIAERDGSWDCHYCGIPLVPLGREEEFCEFDGDGTFSPPDDMRMPTVDHVVPSTRGGSNKLENLVLACSSCNRAKGARI